MRWKPPGFGAIEVDGIVHERDVVLDREAIGRRRKKTSKKIRERYGHTPRLPAEELPWRCRRLIVGTGYEGAVPLMAEVREEAERWASTSSPFRPRRRSPGSIAPARTPT